MILAILALGGVSFILSLVVTAAMRRVAPVLGFIDKPGGRKIHANPKPLLGGVGIVAGFLIPMVVGVIGSLFVHGAIESKSDPVYTSTTTDSRTVETYTTTGRVWVNAAYIDGAKQQLPLAVGLILAVLAIHILGLFDDHKALGPYLKLFVQLGTAAAVVIVMEILARDTPSLRLRILTTLDSLGAGPVPSIILTVLWIVAITNAFNFLDNMDGLSAGVGAVSTTAFLVTTLLIEQWFVAACLAMLLGALLGFLIWNFPPAKIFMGDSGSMVIGLILGILTVRTTFLPRGVAFGAGWYAVFAPVIVLALPLYDLIVVSIIRISRGKSPFVGDTNHFSHRLVARGMSKRTAVLCLYLVTATTSIAAIVLPHVSHPLGAPLIIVQTLLILGLVALLEQHPLAAAKEAIPPSDPLPIVDAPSSSTATGKP